jgi:hypothetical protein
LAEEAPRRKARIRREGEEAEADVSPADVAPVRPQPVIQTMPQPIATQQPVIAPDIRDELTTLIQDLLLKTHELSFEYSTMECEDLSACPLGKKCKELFKIVKRLNEVVRKATPPPVG